MALDEPMSNLKSVIELAFPTIQFTFPRPRSVETSYRRAKEQATVKKANNKKDSKPSSKSRLLFNLGLCVHDRGLVG